MIPGRITPEISRLLGANGGLFRFVHCCSVSEMVLECGFDTKDSVELTWYLCLHEGLGRDGWITFTAVSGISELFGQVLGFHYLGPLQLV